MPDRQADETERHLQGRCGEVWGDAGRCGEVWGRCGDMWGDLGRCGEMWGDVARCGEMGEMWEADEARGGATCATEGQRTAGRLGLGLGLGLGLA